MTNLNKAIATKPGQPTKRVALTEAEIQERQAKIESVAAERARTDYLSKRRGEYPKIGDQLDAILKHLNWRRLEGDNLADPLDTIVNEWLAVKAKYPKPEDNS